MMQERKTTINIVINVVWLVVGGVLIGLAAAGKIDSFWNGMGSGLLIVGIIHLLRMYRLNKNESYREKIEIEVNDERNCFLRNKAWAWSGYLFIILSAVASIFFRIIGQNLLSMAASMAVCMMVVIYWISYALLKRKY